jgi:hypothetical protein
MKELIEQILSLKGGNWTSLLTDKLGFSMEQATAFVPNSLKQVFKVFEKGKLDLGSLLGGGGVSKLMEQVNLDKIAKKSGVEPDKAREGLEQLMPDMLATVKDKAGDADGLLAMLGNQGDVLGKARDIAGKLFGK